MVDNKEHVLWFYVVMDAAILIFLALTVSAQYCVEKMNILRSQKGQNIEFCSNSKDYT